MEKIVIYTDGGCHGNPGPGGWAYYLIASGGEPGDEQVWCDSGYDPATTNNRMELTAVIRGLEDCKVRGALGHCLIRTDSQYVRQGITDWIHRWRRNGWRTAAKTPVKNVDLWQRLDALNEEIAPRWEWVKGHAGDHYNEACDQLVQKAIGSKGQA
ncbi:ribonuclease H [Alkalispirochaeta sphaeroplastigenens]|uniref:Ribonuclease H n=1 Tax=Alkalispirochaeta sphaeroplastigenens TaxID=1187066 RepID=A0A2S4JGG6_9SPIO|nr:MULTISPECIES: ribonuclease HI [Alkalispirochaeta]POQ98579.1 ribonuclease H [Alkalispirochaeta sphaeroplastigenens]